MSGIIFLHGASSSGKSTLARAVQAKIDEPFWHYSIDHLRDSGIVPMARIRARRFSLERGPRVRSSRASTVRSRRSQMRETTSSSSTSSIRRLARAAPGAPRAAPRALRRPSSYRSPNSTAVKPPAAIDRWVAPRRTTTRSMSAAATTSSSIPSAISTTMSTGCSPRGRRRRGAARSLRSGAAGIGVGAEQARARLALAQVDRDRWSRSSSRSRW